MQQQKSPTLTTIFSEVLANLAFMFTDEEQVGAGSEESWLETAISYRGPLVGTLQFRCTTGFSVLLAANLLGIDSQEQEAEDKARDAVKEFMNIVCGQLVTVLYGADAVFNLTIPEVTELPEPPELEPGDSTNSSTLSVDGFMVQLVHLPGSASSPTA
jgi:CheY-specific phosphatase CheX